MDRAGDDPDSTPQPTEMETFLPGPASLVANTGLTGPNIKPFLPSHGTETSPHETL